MQVVNKRLCSRFDECPFGRKEQTGTLWRIPSFPNEAYPFCATTLVTCSAVQQTLEHLSQFFFLQLGADLLNENPFEGMMALRVNHSGVGFADIKVHLYQYNQAKEITAEGPPTGERLAVVFLPLTQNVRLNDFSAIYHAARNFFADQDPHFQSEEGTFTNNNGGESPQLSSKDESLSLQRDDEYEEMSLEGASIFSFESHIPTEDEWEQVCMNTDPNSEDEMMAFRQMVFSYDEQNESLDSMDCIKSKQSMVFHPVVDVLSRTDRNFTLSALRSAHTCHIMANILCLLGSLDSYGASSLLPLCDIAQLCIDENLLNSNPSSRSRYIARLIHNVLENQRSELSEDICTALVNMLEPCLNDTKVIQSDTQRYLRSALSMLQ